MKKSRPAVPACSRRPSFESLLLRRASVVALLMASGGGLNAATVTWDGPLTGNASWGDAVNWSGDILPGPEDTVQFVTGTASTVVSLDASREIASLYFNSANTSYTVGTAADAIAGYSLSLGHVKRDTTAGGTQTIRANVALSQVQSIWEINAGFNNGVTVTGVISGAGKTLNKWGGGSLVLGAANTFDGGVTVNAGTLVLDFNQGTAPLANILATGTTLAVGRGSTVNLNGKNGNSVSQSLAGTSLLTGNSSFTITNGSTAGTRTMLNLGGITREAGAVVNFTQPTGTGNTAVGATNGFSTSTANDASGILGAYATVGTEYATNDGTNIVAYSGYSDLAGDGASFTDAPNSNVRITSGSTGEIGQGAGTTTINTLRVNDAAARTITVGSGNTLRVGVVGGVLATGAGGLTIGASGNAGTFTAGGTDNTAGELIINNTTAVTINSVVSDNGSGAVALVKTGSGTTTLNSAATHTGGTIVNNGVLQLSAGTDQLSAAGNIIVNGGTLNLGTGTQNLSAGLVMNGGTLSNGTITKSGDNYDIRSGTISAVLAGSVGLVKSTAGTASLSANNSYTGTTTVLEGRLNATVAGATKGNIVVGSIDGGNEAIFAGSGVDAVANSANATVYKNGFFSLGNGDNLNSVTIVGGRFTSNNGYVNGTITMTGGTINGGSNTGIYGNVSSIVVNGSSETATIAGSLIGGASTKTFTVNDGAAATDLNVSGGISAGTSVVKAGAGLMAASGSSAYTGFTNVTGGTLSVNTLANGGSNSAIGAASNAATNLRLGNGTTLRYTGSGHSTDRLFTVNGSAADHSATLEASGTGAVDFTNTGNIAWGSNNQTRSLKLGGTSTANNTLAATIANNGSGLVSLVKQDAGKWIISGTNTYTGTTSVNGGSLIVNGSLASGSAVTVNSGGTLGGSGTIGGSVTVESGGFLAPGNSPGILTVGSLNLATGSTTSLEIAGAAVRGTDFDGINVTTSSGLTYGGVLSLGFTSTLTDGDALDLFSFTGTAGGSFTSVVSTGNYAGTWTGDNGVWTFEGNGQVLTFTQSTGDLNVMGALIPEPSTFALVGGLLALATAAGRRRRA